MTTMSSQQFWHTSLQTTNWPTLCSALMANKQWYLQYNTASSKSSLVKWLATKYPCNSQNGYHQWDIIILIHVLEQVVWRVGNAIQWINVSKTYHTIHWTVIYKSYPPFKPLWPETWVGKVKSLFAPSGPSGWSLSQVSVALTGWWLIVGLPSCSSTM